MPYGLPPGGSAPQPWFATGPQNNFVAQSGFITCTGGATANTKGAWSQIIASTSASINLIIFNASSSIYSTDHSVMYDIGVGAAGSESVVAQNIAGGNTTYSYIPQLFLPIAIPAGSRIAYRCQGNAASRAGYGYMTFHSMPDYGLSPKSVDTIGEDTSTSRGTIMTGASGTWTQITSSTRKAYQAFCIFPSNYQAVGVNSDVRLTLGYGAAGAEVAIGQITFSQNSSGAISQRAAYADQFPPIGFSLPAGQRLAIRHNITANPDRVQAVVIGVPFA